MCIFHWVDNLYLHKTKEHDTTQVKRKHGSPPKQKKDTNKNQTPAANTCTIQPKQGHKNSKTEIIWRNLIQHIKKECKKVR